MDENEIKKPAENAGATPPPEGNPAPQPGGNAAEEKKPEKQFNRDEVNKIVAAEAKKAAERFYNSLPQFS